MTTLEQTPGYATHWSTRSLAKKVGVAAASVGRTWDASGIQAWCAEGRFQPLVQVPATPERPSQDYTRHDTTSLLAALNTLDGRVIASLHNRHRAVDFKKFLGRIDGVPVPPALHAYGIELAQSD